MKKTERQERMILDLLQSRNVIKLAEATEILGVSESTVRRLFIRLENSGAAVRRYGGIQLIHDSASGDYLYEKVEEKSMPEKRRIGMRAALLAEDGDVLYLDCGTTLACFCSALAERLASGEVKDVTIFTNSLSNLEILKELGKVELIGGEYRPRRRDLCGYLAEEAVGKLHFTKCFLGCDGFHPRYGFMATDFSTARLNELAMNNSDRSYVLMDGSKFFSASVVSYSGTNRVDAVITDVRPSDTLSECLEGLASELIVCG